MPAELGDGILDHIVSPVAVDRDSTNGTHEPAQWWQEKRVLAPPFCVDAQPPFGSKADDEVPVGGMWCHDQHEPWQVGDLPLETPSRHSHPPCAELFEPRMVRSGSAGTEAPAGFGCGGSNLAH